MTQQRDPVTALRKWPTAMAAWSVAPLAWAAGLKRIEAEQGVASGALTADKLRVMATLRGYRLPEIGLPA